MTRDETFSQYLALQAELTDAFTSMHGEPEVIERLTDELSKLRRRLKVELGSSVEPEGETADAMDSSLGQPMQPAATPPPTSVGHQAPGA